MGRIPEEAVQGVKCPKCGGIKINVCQPCGRKKYKCLDCRYLGNIDKFIKIEKE